MGFVWLHEHGILPVFVVDVILGFGHCCFGVRPFLGVVLERVTRKLVPNKCALSQCQLFSV